MSGRIVVVGSVNVDLVVRVASLPRAGETVLGHGFQQQTGGKGANQAVAAARLGAEVCFVGRTGEDAFGASARATLAAEGVDLTHLSTDPREPTGVALIAVDLEAENAIAVAPGANAELARDHVLAAADTIAAADVLLVQLEVPVPTVTAALELARANDTLAVVNPAPVPADARSLGTLADVLTPNEPELAVLLGTNELPSTSDGWRAAAAQLGVAHLVVTRGARGVVHVHGGDVAELPTRTVDAVDTTGAGDAFNGALAVGLATGRPIHDAIRAANAAAALAVTRAGALPAMARASELAEFPTLQ